MSNPIIDNIRLSLGRTFQTPLRPRPAIYMPRLSESMDTEINRFLDEIKKLSGIGQQLSSTGLFEALKTLVVEQNIRKVTVWNTSYLNQIQITNYLSSIGVELISPNANKHEIAQCDLGITEADFLLPETGTLVLRSSSEKPRAVSLVPRIHLAI
ncbi:MAG: LUD domain-containing protein, partial [Anaerolineales bacterium]